MDESGTDEADCRRKVVSGRMATGAIMSLVNVRGLQLECDKVLHETLVVPVRMYGSETLIWEEKEEFRIRTVQMDNHRGLVGIRRMDKVPKAWIR